MVDLAGMVFLFVSLLRMALFAAMSVVPYLLLRDIENCQICNHSPCDRKPNPSTLHGLRLIASSGVALLALQVRLVLMRFVEEGGTLNWWLFNRDPDMVGELGGALFSLIAVGGILLHIRGTRALLFRGAQGELPHGVGPRGGA